MCAVKARRQKRKWRTAFPAHCTRYWHTGTCGKSLNVYLQLHHNEMLVKCFSLWGKKWNFHLSAGAYTMSISRDMFGVWNLLHSLFSLQVNKAYSSSHDELLRFDDLNPKFLLFLSRYIFSRLLQLALLWCYFMYKLLPSQTMHPQASVQSFKTWC